MNNVDINPEVYVYFKDEDDFLFPIVTRKENIQDDFPIPCICKKCACKEVCKRTIRNIISNDCRNSNE